jgi:hypothetical protein
MEGRKHGRKNHWYVQLRNYDIIAAAVAATWFQTIPLLFGHLSRNCSRATPLPQQIIARTATLVAFRDRTENSSGSNPPSQANLSVFAQNALARGAC